MVRSDKLLGYLCIITCLLFILFDSPLVSGYSQTTEILSLVPGRVGGGNYSYHSADIYRLGKKWRDLALALRSTSGDADLYVSVGKNKEPTFSDFDYHEATCGMDVLKLSEFADDIGEGPGRERPDVLTLGVYGHPRFHVSGFQLALIAGYDGDIDAVEDTLRNLAGSEPSDSRGSQDSNHFSVIWTVLAFLVEIGVDILL